MLFFFFFKQKTAYDIKECDWSSDVCSSDLASYPKKHMEPVSRTQNEQIPHRFNELIIYTAKNQTKIMISKQPIITYSSFTVLKPTGINFSLVFYQQPEVMESINFFMTQTLNKEAGIPKADAKKATKLIVEGLNKFSIW